MPANLLHELEAITPEPIDQAENTDKALQQIEQAVKRISWAMEHSKGSVSLFEKTWRNMIAAVAEGRTAEVHQLREVFRKAVEDRLGLLKRTQAQAAFLHGLGIQTIPDPEILVPEITGIERMKSRVCDPWKTAEDLEDLAARDYPLTAADLDRIGAQCMPPASWYAEEGKPF